MKDLKTTHFSWLDQRNQSTLKTISFDDLSQEDFKKEDGLLFYSSDELGVILNGGRRGAVFGPQAIIHQLSKQQSHQNKRLFYHHIYKNFSLQANLDELQDRESSILRNHVEWQKTDKFVHLGSGHDHVYPLIKSIEESSLFDKLIVINIDAHLDTRTDTIHHSGTPFRQWMRFSQKMSKQVEFYQLGIQQESNPPSNYQKEKFPMKIFSDREINQNGIPNDLKQVLASLSHNDFILLSLDVDGLSGYEYLAVSSPNPFGIKSEKMFELIDSVKSSSAKKTFGIYEYNPLFDDLSTRCAARLARMISSFLF